MQSNTYEAYDPRQQEADRAEINQLARMMPDPQEDELFDDGRLSPTTSTICLLAGACVPCCSMPMQFCMAGHLHQ